MLVTGICLWRLASGAPVGPHINSVTDPVDPETDMTITGTTLGGTLVDVLINDAISLLPVVSQSSTTIVCTIPALPGGSYNIKVVTSDGTSNSVSFNVNAVAPSPASMSFDLADHSTGDTLTIFGTNMTGITAVELRENGSGGAWTSATLGATDDTTYQSFVMPSVSAGMYDVRVTNSVGSATLTNALEAWEPTDEPNCTALWEMPGYTNSAGTAHWVARFGSDIINGATNAPAAGSGWPAFAGSQWLTGPDINSLLTYGTPSEGTVSYVGTWSIANADHPTDPIANDGIFADSFGQAGMSFSTAGVRAFLLDDVGGIQTLAVAQAATVAHAASMRFKDAEAIWLSVNGSAYGDNSTPFDIFIKGAVGTAVILGNNNDMSAGINGELFAICFHNAKVSDTFASKFYRWAQQHFGIS